MGEVLTPGQEDKKEVTEQQFEAAAGQAANPAADEEIVPPTAEEHAENLRKIAEKQQPETWQTGEQNH